MGVISLYQLADVIDVETMQTKRDAWNIIGKDFDLHNLEIGERATLNNISDSHIYQQVTKTSIIDNIKESLKEISIIAKDTMYILKKY